MKREYVDLQVNGFAGVDFSTLELDYDSFMKAAEKIFSTDTAVFLPTIVTSDIPLYERNISIIKNAVEKNQKTTKDVKNIISSKSSETNGKLDSLHANLCGGGSIHDIVGQILDKISEQQSGSSSEDDSANDQNNDYDTQEKSKNKKQKKREKKKYT